MRAPPRNSSASSSGPERTEAATACTGPGRRRCHEAKQAIERATLTLLRRRGFDALTIEAVAEEAGVGKATVYRWWPNKAILVVEAFFAAIAPRLPYPDTGSVRTDFEQQMRLVVDEMSGPTGRMLAQLVAATQCDKALRAAFRERWLRPRRAEGLAAVKRGIERGELPRSLDSEFLFDLLYGPLYVRLLFEHAPLDRAFVRRLIKTAFDGISIQSPRKRER